MRTRSPIDILVLAKRSDWEFRDRVYDQVLEVEMESGVPLSVKACTPEQWEFFRKHGSPFVDAVESEGVRVWTSP